MKKISEIIDESGIKSGNGEVDRFLKLVRNWPEITGAELSGKLEIKKLKNGILYIGVQDSTWLQNMMYMKSVLLGNIRKIDNSVKDVRFSVEKKSRTPGRARKKIDDVKIEDTENNLEIEKLIDSLKDEELRNLFRIFWTRTRKFRKIAHELGYDICKKCNSLYNDKKCPWCGERN